MLIKKNRFYFIEYQFCNKTLNLLSFVFKSKSGVYLENSFFMSSQVYLENNKLNVIGKIIILINVSKCFILY